MDNITHSLIGAAVGDWIHNKEKIKNSESAAQRRLWIWASIIGNNFPDIDVLYTKITPGPLGSLLHHRGHTHTFVGLLPQWLMIIALLWVLRKPLRFDQLTKQDWQIGFIISGLGLCLHIFADFWNSYGVHPFFPFSNRWFYGDAIFIIEPFIWAIVGGSLLSSGTTKFRFLPAGFLCGLIAFGISNDYIGIVSIAAIVTLYAVSFFVRRALKETFPAFAVVTVLMFVGTLFFTSLHLRSEVIAFAPPTHQILDVALMPAPASPICWMAIRVAVVDTNYEVRRGLISLLPSVLPIDQCQTLGRVSSKPEESLDLGTSRLAWTETYQMPLKGFKVLEKDCSARAWMRFARVPFIASDGYTELRFSGGRMRGFADMSSGAADLCPPLVPDWVPPRWDLIQKLGGESWF